MKARSESALTPLGKFAAALFLLVIALVGAAVAYFIFCAGVALKNAAATAEGALEQSTAAFVPAPAVTEADDSAPLNGNPHESFWQDGNRYYYRASQQQVTGVYIHSTGQVRAEADGWATMPPPTGETVWYAYGPATDHPIISTTQTPTAIYWRTADGAEHPYQTNPAQ